MRSPGEYGFWLDDAFASGGSAGYDHKKMGITARGAWESVKRHFRELGHDIQTTPFTVVGVGDMSGDVFGNGMLLSQAHQAGRRLRPSPHLHRSRRPIRRRAGPSASACSTCRARRGWTTTSRCCRRAAASSTAPPSRSRCRPRRARCWASRRRAMTPVDLMRAILTAPVDLLYFGGIGTYVKASSESHADAGDRANDAAAHRRRRSCAPAWSARAPISASPSAAASRRRWRAARSTPTRSTTRPASTPPTTRSTSRSRPARRSRAARWRATTATRCCSRMTDEVAALVLRHNYQQSQAISVAEAQAGEEHDRLERFMRALERQGRLDRAVEFLPDTAAMRTRAPEPPVPDPARALGAAGLRQDRPQRRDPRLRPARRSAARGRAAALLPDGAAGEATSRRSAPIACAARSPRCRS